MIGIYRWSSAWNRNEWWNLNLMNTRGMPSGSQRKKVFWREWNWGADYKCHKSQAAGRNRKTVNDWDKNWSATAQSFLRSGPVSAISRWLPLKFKGRKAAWKAPQELNGWWRISTVDITHTDTFSNECFPIPTSTDTEDTKTRYIWHVLIVLFHLSCHLMRLVALVPVHCSRCSIFTYVTLKNISHFKYVKRNPDHVL